MTAAFAVRSVTEQDWLRVRALRLEMLADTPIAFLETLRTAEAHPVEHWRRQARGRPGGCRLVAEARDGRFIGTMSGVTALGSPTLVAVYVTPEFRGGASGVTDALLAGVEAWARQHGDVLRLEVHEDNARAIAAYEHRGFVLTGRTLPYPLAPGGVELEMAKPLPRTL